MNALTLLQACQEKARPASFEREFGELMASHASGEISTDALRNVTCHREGPGKKLMATAHMDCFGFMVNHIDGDGRIFFQPYGKTDGYLLLEQEVLLEGGVHGVVLALETAANKPLGSLGTVDLYIDIGSSSREETERCIQKGSYGVYYTALAEMADGYLRMSGGNNLAGCVALLMALERLGKSENDLYAVFTSMNRPGPTGRGALAAAYNIRPDAGITVGGVGTKDGLAQSSWDGPATPGDGPAVKMKEERFLCDPPVIEHIKRAAKAAGIPLQSEVWPQSMPGFSDPEGTSDMPSIQNSRGGVPVSGVSIPMRYRGAVTQILNLKDLEQAADLVCEALKIAF